jgi:DNA primase
MDSIDEIKQKLDIVDLVGGYVEIKKAGRNYKGLCPFHSEKTPSFMVSPELQIYKCFGCGEGGDIFSFHQKIEGLDFPQSLERLAERVGVKLPKRPFDPERSKKKIIYELNDLTSRYYHYLLTEHKVGKPALKYLKEERGLTDEIIKEFNIGYSPDSWDSLYKFLNSKKYKNENLLSAGLIVNKKSGDGYIDKFRKRIIFPLIGVDGRIVGFTGRALGDGGPKYLNSPETPVFHKSSFLFGLDKAKVALKQDGAVFVEGQMDVISAHQAGVINVVASSGTSLTIGQLKLLSRYTRDITFAFDSDRAGLTAVHRAIDLAEKQDFHIKVAMIPEKYADLDEFVRAKPKKVKVFVSEGIPAYDFFLVSALRRHRMESPIGKKKAMAELIPIFSKISDPVLRDHYIKKISAEVDVTESVVASLLTDSGSEEAKSFLSPKVKETREQQFALSKKSREEYIIALLLKAPLESAQTMLYKLGQKDFTSIQLQEIFMSLKKYLVGRKRKFKIHHFAKRFEDDLKNLVDELYLWDIGELAENEEQLNKELENVFDLLKKKTAKGELKELGKQIKQAELENNEELLKELSQEFKELSEKLI